MRPNPSAEELAEVASLAAIHVQRFNMKPRVAFVSHSDFGSYDTDSSRKMRRATALLKEKASGDRGRRRNAGRYRARPPARKLVLPHSNLEGDANILIMPNLDTANVAYQMIKTLADALPVGPILIGPARPGAYPHPGRDGARRPQHDGGCRRRSLGARGAVGSRPSSGRVLGPIGQDRGSSRLVLKRFFARTAASCA